MLHNEIGSTIWTIGEMDELVDTFRCPMPSSKFRIEEGGVIGWPSFHVSEADPEGKYQCYEYIISFFLDQVCDMELYIGYIVSTPRYPKLEITVNGSKGMYYPYPTPSQDKEIKPGHALHASIYNRESIRLYLPEELFRKGENMIAFIARDESPVIKIVNEQAVLRLDRMADACGFHYGSLELKRLKEKPNLNQLEAQPSVIYKKDSAGNLFEKCVLRFTNLISVKKTLKGEMLLTWNNNQAIVPYSFEVPSFGQVIMPFYIPDGEGKVEYNISGDLNYQGSFYRKKKWKVFTTPHAHTDIGYTHRQWEVAERMCRNIDTALDMLKGEFKNHFAYIIDGTWHLEEYIKTRSKERIGELLRAVADGKIGIPWNYADLLTQLPTLEGLIHNGDFSRDFLGPIGLKADRADIVDVASATMAYPGVLSGCGVKYLLHADNQDRGPFRLNGELHRHSPFWWKAPDGSRVLTWLARMYCELKKVCGSPTTVEAAERGLELWLMDYDREDYHSDAVLLYGQEADNTDLDIRSGEFMAKWEEEIEYPKLIPSNGSAFFDYIMKFADSFEEFSGDEGGYWEDGAASSIIETIAVRKAEAGIRCAEILDSLAILHSEHLSFPYMDYQEAWKQVLLYEEHTWGAFLSGSDPEALLQQDQWEVKAHMADQAKQWSKRLIVQATSKISLMWNNQSREIVVYNPYSFRMAGLIEIEIARNETIIYEDKEVDWEEISNTENLVLAGLWVDTLDPMSYRRYRLRIRGTKDDGGAGKENLSTGHEVMENDWYFVKIDCSTGNIISFYDKELKKELSSGNTLGQLLYAYGGEGTSLLGNRPGLSKEGAKVLPCFRPLKTKKKITKIGTSIYCEGPAELGSLKVTYTLPKKEKYLGLTYDYDKKETDQLEAVYIDFPFAVSEYSAVRSDSQMGWVDWHQNVLPGACREWLPLQTSILIKGDGLDIQIASPDAFLFTIGNPVMGKWSSELETRGNHIYSYVLNNYWRVNYKGRQGGQLCLRYAITSAKAIAYEKAYQFGWSKRQGLIAQRMSYQEFRVDNPKVYRNHQEGKLLSVKSEHIVISTLRGSRDGQGLIVRIQEIGGLQGEIVIDFGGRLIKRITRMDHQERPLEQLQTRLDNQIIFGLKSWEVATYEIILE
jgi:hypothetical protein